MEEGSEVRAGGGGFGDKHRAFVGVEAGQDGDLGPLTGFPGVDGRDGDDAPLTIDGGLEGPADGRFVLVIDGF